MIDETQIPYTITKGVTATREGLFFDSDQYALSSFFGAAFDIDGVADEAWKYGAVRSPGDYWLSWPDAAEQLRYRDGEPWCHALSGALCCSRADKMPQTGHRLHRLAAILCDDSEAFEVLHWCVAELHEVRND